MAYVVFVSTGVVAIVLPRSWCLHHRTVFLTSIRNQLQILKKTLNALSPKPTTKPEALAAAMSQVSGIMMLLGLSGILEAEALG